MLHNFNYLLKIPIYLLYLIHIVNMSTISHTIGLHFSVDHRVNRSHCQPWLLTRRQAPDISSPGVVAISLALLGQWAFFFFFFLKREPLKYAKEVCVGFLFGSLCGLAFSFSQFHMAQSLATCSMSAVEGPLPTSLASRALHPSHFTKGCCLKD